MFVVQPRIGNSDWSILPSPRLGVRTLGLTVRKIAPFPCASAQMPCCWWSACRMKASHHTPSIDGFSLFLNSNTHRAAEITEPSNGCSRSQSSRYIGGDDAYRRCYSRWSHSSVGLQQQRSCDGSAPHRAYKRWHCVPNTRCSGERLVSDTK